MQAVMDMTNSYTKMLPLRASSTQLRYSLESKFIVSESPPARSPGMNGWADILARLE